jgi:UDP-2,3-diacylglucosamine hydrolase
MNKKIYFASDFHFGIPDRESSLARESTLIRWLDRIREDAGEIYLMGDLFDFWFEYGKVVPKGYVRLLGKLAQITDSGIPVHLFRGNHDMWAFSYLQKEIGIQLHRDPEFRTFGARKFYLAHGDGLGPGDHGYKMLKKVFSCRLNQWLFSWIHPDLGIPVALFWSRKSRYASVSRENREEERNLRLIESRTSVHSEKLLKSHPELDFLVYGHYHAPLLRQIGPKAVQVVLGDWITHFTYAVFDGETLELLEFPDDEPVAEGEIERNDE